MLPTARIINKDIQLKYGGSGIIKCIASGKPKPSVSWFVNNTEISNSNDFVINGNNLYVLNANDQLNHATLTCRASNSLGYFAEESMQVNLKYMLDLRGADLNINPSFITTHFIQSFVSGSSHFECDLKSTKDKNLFLNLNDFEFKWYKSSGEFIKSAKGGQLFVSNINEKDLGVYYCQLENLKTKETSTKAYLDLTKFTI